MRGSAAAALVPCIPLIVGCSALGLFDRSRLIPDDASDEPSVDALDVVEEETADDSSDVDDEAECTVDEDCDDDDPCTEDTCDTDLHMCNNTRMGSPRMMLATPVNLTMSSQEQGEPNIAWTGTSYGIFWSLSDCTACPLYYARLAGDGSREISNTVIADTEQTSDYTYQAYPEAVWTGSEFGVVWHEHVTSGTSLFFNRFDTEGAAQGTESQPSETSRPRWPDLTWTGSEFGLVWVNDGSGGSSSRFMVRNADGTERVAETPVGTSTGYTRQSAVWTGSEFVVFWSESGGTAYRVLFTRLTPAGSLVGTTEEYFTSDVGGSRAPSAVWTGSEIAFAWQNDRDGDYQPYFMRADALGAPASSELRVGVLGGIGSGRPELAWIESAFGIAWEEEVGGNRDIHFGLVNATGDDVLLYQPVSSSSGNATSMSMTWTGSEFGLVWLDDSDGSNDVMFNRFNLCG